MNLPFFSKNNKIGIDIGSYSIKVIQSVLNSSNAYKIKSAGYKISPILLNNNILDVDDSLLSKAIIDLFKENKIKGNKVFLTLSDPSIYLRHITIPSVPENEIIKAIKWQAEKYIPFPIDEAIVDYQYLDPSSKHQSDNIDIVLVAVRKDIINKYINILKNAHLYPCNINTTPFTIAHGFIKSSNTKKDKMIALVDIGYQSTFVTILKGSSLHFVKNINLGISHLIHEIIRANKLNKNETSSIINEIINLESIQKYKYFPQIEISLNYLIEDINRCFAYCETASLCESIHEIELCGGGALLKNIDSYLKDKLNIPVNISYLFNSDFYNISINNDINNIENAPCFLGAFGATL